MPVKFASGVTVITPVALTLTVPLVTGITCAVPGVSGTPLMLTTLKVSTSRSVSAVSGVKVTVPSSATV